MLYSNREEARREVFTPRAELQGEKNEKSHGPEESEKGKDFEKFSVQTVQLSNCP